LAGAPARTPVFSRWKADSLKRTPQILAAEWRQGDERQRAAELERMVGRLTMELEVAKEAPDAFSLGEMAGDLGVG